MFTSIKLSKKQLEDTGPMRSWQPVELDEAQFTIVNILCSRDENIDDPDFVSYVASHGRSAEEFVDSLVQTTLVARNGRLLQLTTSKCECMVLPDGRFIAADNNTGRLTRWLGHYLEERKSKAREADEDRGA